MNEATSVVTETKNSKDWQRTWRGSMPLAVLLLVLALAGAMAFVANMFAREQQQARFLREVMDHKQTWYTFMGQYENLLNASSAAWMAVSGDPTLDVFNKYTVGLDLPKYYPAIQSIGYAARAAVNDQAVLDSLPAAAGYQRFKIRSEEKGQSMYAPVLMVAPPIPENLAIRGFDLYSVPEIRQALVAAMKSNRNKTTMAMNINQMEGIEGLQPGFMSFLPIWQQNGNNSSKPRGFIFITVDLAKFMARLNSQLDDKGIQVQLKLANHDLSSKGRIKPLPNDFFQEITEHWGGQTWQFTYRASSQFGKDPVSNVPLFIIGAGLLVAGLAYHITRAQVKGREEAELTSNMLAAAHVHQERARAEFEAIFQSMQDAAAFTDESGKVRMINHALAKQFHVKQKEVATCSLSRLHVDRRLDTRLTFQALTTPYQRSDGSRFYGEAQRTEVQDNNGTVLGLLEVIRDVSDRVSAEQAIRAQESRSNRVLDAVPHILWVLNQDAQPIYANHQHQLRLGGQRVIDRIHADDLALYHKMWESAYVSMMPEQCMVRLHTNSSETVISARERWFEIHVAPVMLDSKQDEVEWVASATDIHDRLIAERAAQRNEAQYRGVLEGMPQIVWLSDPQGRITYFNRQWANYVGTPRAMNGFLATIHPDDRMEYQVRWNAAVRSGMAFEAEHRLLRSDGVYRTFVTRGLPIRDGQGRILEWVGTSTDVDDSVFAENAAHLLSEVSETLSARVNDPVGSRKAQYQWVFNRITDRFVDGAIIWAAPDLNEVARAKVKTTWDAPDMQASIKRMVEEVIKESEPVYITDHPKVQEVGLTGIIFYPLIGRDGMVWGVMGLAHRQVLQDREHELVAELAKRLSNALENDALRNQANAAGVALQKMNQSLEDRVKRRTLELEEANRELEAFSYSVSHDLRTPLRHIVGFGDLLTKEAENKLGAKGNRYVSVIVEAATRMSGLIDSLLEFSRMGRAQLNVVPVELKPIVEQVWRNLEPDRVGREVRLTVNPLPQILGDPSLLDLVFQNLLSNALKYTKTREIAYIEVSAYHEESWMTIAISDNGVGFDEQYSDKLFGVFQRLHRPEEFDGIGIGLANVRRIITRHGGMVRATGKVDEGATFYLSFPLEFTEKVC